MSKDINKFFEEKLTEAKVNFERTIDCKHTAFDDLYPYMNEQPQFFWYKRYAGWQELLTVVSLAEELEINWKTPFTERQVAYIEKKVLDAKVLDYWYEDSKKEQEVNKEDN
ncbi:hypothetical protein [Bacillus sp. FJAT-45350]|uniref:hypothetical protein n=1 Tax=Bacillus sp. FJAT-45350 TaxID=2011014 RepID=UPI000BB8C379|nr:hypothetical protein [Bacillus sp. FJAT-45350]